MAKLIYMATTSLDGYTEDATGSIEWSAPDQEAHAFVNELLRPIGTFLFGPRMYETMLYWETAHALIDLSDVAADFEKIWRATDKIVYSKTLDTAPSARTRVERHFDADAIRQLKAEAKRDISVGGAELAAQAIEAGLVDELYLFVVAIVIGGGKRYLPNNAHMNLELLDERRFHSGTVYLHYRIRK